MRNIMKMAGWMIALVFVTVQAYAVMESAELQAPGKSLGDFQKAYSGTKPVVAWHKYQEYLMLEKAPRTTLAPSRMREETASADPAHGSKPVIGLLKRR